jgi:S1-C subfamily serine protease
VRDVVRDSAAAAAGLQRGDLLVRAGEKPLASMDDLFDALDGASDTLTVGLLRGSEEREVDVPLRTG